MLRKILLPLAAATLTLVTLTATGDNRHRNRPVRVSAELSPLNEVPLLSSVGSGSFRATVDRENQTISYEVSYEGLEGALTQAHIHLGIPRTNGGISVFLCANAPAGPPAPAPTPPPCPPAPATVTGVITPASIFGPNAQGLAPTSDTVNEFDELVDLILSEHTYANVHSAKFPAGEVRGQVRVGRQRH